MPKIQLRRKNAIPFVMGVLNVTPDSFSDGGQWIDQDAAVRRALEMLKNGADVIDIGGESTRPGADPVPEAEELRRVIPVIKALREGFGGNQITSIHGILNGTCNYILTTMRETGRAFDDVLSEAQELGYAELDPSFDIDGVDAAHKLAILTSVAFGTEVDFDSMHVEGIRHVAAEDIEYAGEFGYRIKLLGISEQTENGIQQRVHPAMVLENAPIAGVEGVFNAVVTEGDFVGTTVLEGRGAGAGPTASAVVADIADIARDRIVRTLFGVPASSLSKSSPASFDDHLGAYYVRLMVDDQPGVFAKIAAVLANHEISIEGVIQRARSETQAVPVVMTTHETTEAAIQKVLAAFAQLDAVREPPHMIRIENFW